MIGDTDGYGYGSGSGSGYGYGSGSGSGYGYGYGDGDGYGYGSGSGYGYGYGDGYGDGDGYGYGYGSGYGYGYGSGDGYGDGYGYGYGDGYGYGYGSDAEQYFAALLGPHQQSGGVAAFWRSTMSGTPANGGSGTVGRVGLVEEIPGPLKLCCRNALHATLQPTRWNGARWWIVLLHHPVEHQADKLGSLKRTFVADLGRCPFT